MKREVVMCDTPDCRSAADGKCAACEKDICIMGLEAHGMLLQFGTRLIGDPALDTNLVMCKACLESVQLDGALRQELLVSLEPFVVFLRAHMAGRALGVKV